MRRKNASQRVKARWIFAVPLLLSLSLWSEARGQQASTSTANQFTIQKNINTHKTNSYAGQGNESPELQPVEVFSAKWGSGLGEVGLYVRPASPTTSPPLAGLRISPYILTVDSAGVVYILDGNNQRVLKVGQSTASEVTQWREEYLSDRLEATGLYVDPEGDIFVLTGGSRKFAVEDGGKLRWFKSGKPQGTHRLPKLVIGKMYIYNGEMRSGLTRGSHTRLHSRKSGTKDDNLEKCHRLQLALQSPSGPAEVGIIDLSVLGPPFSGKITAKGNAHTIYILGIDQRNRVFVALKNFGPYFPNGTRRSSHVEVWVYSHKAELITKIMPKQDLEQWATNMQFWSYEQLAVSPEGSLYQVWTHPEGLKILKWPLKENP